MDSIARGLTALSPSIGAAEDFISKKGIPDEQVPAFLAKLGDPQLAGLIAQKQRLKQEQAKQVPPGGPQQGPPTVKDEINQQLLQIQQAQQQKQMGQQPGQPPMPPQGAPQGGPPVQAAGGGLMGMGLGGLDAGSMEAPHHFDGGGVVAFAQGKIVDSGKTVKKKEEIEQPADPYQKYYDTLTKQEEEYKALGPYKQLEDPTYLERQKLYEKRQSEAKQKYDEDRANASRLGWLAAMEAAGSGKSLYQTITTQMQTQEEKRLAADDKYETAKKDLEDNLVELHKAEQAYKETGNKEDYNWKVKLQDKVSGLHDDMLKTMIDQTKYKADQDYRMKELNMQERQLNKATDLTNSTVDFFRDLKSAQIKGDPSLKGLTDDQLRAKAREKAITLTVGLKLEAAGEQNLVDNLSKLQDAAAKAQSLYDRNNAIYGPNDPKTLAAKQDADQAKSLVTQVAEKAKLTSSSSAAGGGSGEWTLLNQ